MRRRRRVIVYLIGALLVLLVVNTLALDRQTKGAAITTAGAKLVDVGGTMVQVLDTGAPPAAQGGPIVLIHCFSCSMQWWSDVIPLLSPSHRIVAIDLLGHGGTNKPNTGYTMTEQARLVAATLHRLDVQRATVVGHSLGGSVTAALAEQSPHLVERAVIIDQAPDNSHGGLDLLAELSTSPVIGEALWRVAPDFAIRKGLGQAFAPGFDIPSTFVDDFRRMTFTSYDQSVAEQVRYTDEVPLTERLERTGVPLLVVFGELDQIYAARAALRAYAAVAGSQTRLIADAGHAPNVEQPAALARLILAFAAPAE